MSLSIGRGFSLGAGFSYNQPPIAVAGSTTTVSVQQGSAITSFNAFASVSNGTTPYTYYVSAGTLPLGITIASGNGLVSGTPTVVQSAANVTFSVKDAINEVASVTSTVGFTVTLAPIVAVAGNTSPISIQKNSAITSFNAFTSVSYGTTPYTYYVSTGTLPPGITINSSSGLVSGTPNTVQSAANVTFSVKDVNNVVASATTTRSFEVTAIPAYTVQYLVVAGGGGGGGGNFGNNGASGGGAGGLLAGCATVIPNTVYTITVGGGGAGGVGTSGGSCPSNPGSAGANSSISGACFSTLTARGGGGGGGAQLATPPAQPTNGGSGGGGYNFTPFGTGGIAFGSPGFGVAGTQGYPGGSTYNGPGGFPDVKAGGGGAGGKGSNAFTPQGAPPGGAGTGAGGAGYTWPYTATTYAGGGGGGSYQNPGATYGIGGPGGGGHGGNCTSPTCRAVTSCGTLNTGGGGGGGGWGQISPNNTPGGVGGSGVVILAIPTPVFPGTATGAAISTPGSAPGMTVLTYTSPARTTPGTFTYTA